MRGHIQERKLLNVLLVKKAFSIKCNLMNHERSHTVEKPFKCSNCSKSFSSKSSLMRHAKVHTGEKPLQCSICDKTFRDQGDLMVHVRVHAVEKQTRKDRFLQFKKDLKDCWSVGYLCCHRKMSTTTGRHYSDVNILNECILFDSIFVIS